MYKSAAPLCESNPETSHLLNTAAESLCLEQLPGTRRTGRNDPQLAYRDHVPAPTRLTFNFNTREEKTCSELQHVL